MLTVYLYLRLCAGYLWGVVEADFQRDYGIELGGGDPPDELAAVSGSVPEPEPVRGGGGPDPGAAGGAGK